MAKGTDVKKYLIIGAVVLALFGLPLLVLAHEGEEQGVVEAHGLSINFTPSDVIQGDSVPIEASITKNGVAVGGLQVSFTVDKHEAGVSEKIETAEREPGKYFAKYEFTDSGAYEVHVEFVHDNETLRETFDIDVIASGLSGGMIFGAAAVILLASIWGYTLTRKKRDIKSGLIWSVVALVLAGLGYSVYVTQASGAAEAGLVVCPQENNCIWQAHIHTYVPITICGEDIRLAVEKGSLQGPHTHEEKNTIHWHDRLPYDRVNEEILNTTPLTMGAFFDAIEVEFASDRILDKKNGDVCPDGKAGTLKMFVNGAPSSEYRNYKWEDKGVVDLVFDSRTEAEVAAELKANPIVFPALGRG